MLSLLFRWLTTTLAIMAVPYLVSGVHVNGFGAALAASAVLGALNALARPILVLLTLPLTILSLGFFLLFINALLFELAGSLVRGVEIASFGSAFLASLVVTFISWLVQAPWKGRVVVMRGGNPFQRVDIRQPRNPMASRPDDAIELDRDENGKWS